MRESLDGRIDWPPDDNEHEKRAFMREVARAAIKAMYEPTEEILAAIRLTQKADATTIFKSSIEAALDPKATSALCSQLDQLWGQIDAELTKVGITRTDSTQ